MKNLVASEFLTELIKLVRKYTPECTPAELVGNLEFVNMELYINPLEYMPLREEVEDGLEAD